MKLTKTVTLAAALAAAVAMTPAIASAASPAIDWKSCGTDSVQCGQIAVPVDWAHPDKVTTIEVARLPAAKPSERIGTLFFNPGGPGEGEVGYLTSAQAREYYFPRTLRDRFDIVAVEPRGTGQNPALNCPMPVDHTVSKFSQQPG